MSNLFYNERSAYSGAGSIDTDYSDIDPIDTPQPHYNLRNRTELINPQFDNNSFTTQGSQSSTETGTASQNSIGSAYRNFQDSHSPDHPSDDELIFNSHQESENAFNNYGVHQHENNRRQPNFPDPPIKLNFTGAPGPLGVDLVEDTEIVPLDCSDPNSTYTEDTSERLFNIMNENTVKNSQQNIVPELFQQVPSTVSPLHQHNRTNSTNRTEISNRASTNQNPRQPHLHQRNRVSFANKRTEISNPASTSQLPVNSHKKRVDSSQPVSTRTNSGKTLTLTVKRFKDRQQRLEDRYVQLERNYANLAKRFKSDHPVDTDIYSAQPCRRNAARSRLNLHELVKVKTAEQITRRPLHLIKRAAEVEALRRRERNGPIWIKQGIYEPMFKWEVKGGADRKIIDELPVNQYWKSLVCSTMRKINPTSEASKFNTDKAWPLEDKALKACRNKTIKLIRSPAPLQHTNTVAKFLLTVKTHNSHLDEAFLTILEQIKILVDKKASWADNRQKEIFDDLMEQLPILADAKTQLDGVWQRTARLAESKKSGETANGDILLINRMLTNFVLPQFENEKEFQVVPEELPFHAPKRSTYKSGEPTNFHPTRKTTNKTVHLLPPKKPVHSASRKD
ncbi:MAG: hypothetical protein HRT61_22670 [Ekhidna sp.]|nr:hypothetical protein [Ekhidna sp.]